MGKDWDRSGIAFHTEMWQELHRVLKPGAHILVAGIARTHHRMWVALEDAGFEIRDGIYHVFGSGFPKSTDISKSLDKMAGKEREVIGTSYIRNGKDGTNNETFKQAKRETTYITAPTSEQAIQWNGWGTALKPSVEIWCLARKPISERNIASNVLKWGCGGINVDGCRIGTNGGTKHIEGEKEYNNEIYGKGLYKEFGKGIAGLGRFPSNLCLECCCEEDELMEADDPTQGHQYKTESNAKSIFGIGTGKTNKDRVTWKKGNKCLIHTNPNCVCRMLDEQGIERGVHSAGSKLDEGEWERPHTHVIMPSFSGKGMRFGDVGGPSRFFYQAKASQNERYFYCTICKQAYPMKDKDNHIHNAPEETKHQYLEFHPTQKPLQLIQYLTRLITPPHGTVLDLFMGTGTTLVAAEQEGFNSIGVDSKLEYCKITEKRLSDVTRQGKIDREPSVIEKIGF